MFIDSGIFYLAKRLYPKVIISYIKSSDIESILDNFSESKKIKLFYTSVVRKKLFGRRETDIKYKRGIYKEAFVEARTIGLWIDRIEIYSEEDRYGFELSRDGIVKILEGFFRDYFMIFEYIAYKYVDKLDFFSNRSREFIINHELRPLKLPFETNLFYEKEIREQFLNMIGNYTECNYSVEYMGNPHLHVIIFDEPRIYCQHCASWILIG